MLENKTKSGKLEWETFSYKTENSKTTSSESQLSIEAREEAKVIFKAKFQAASLILTYEHFHIGQKQSVQIQISSDAPVSSGGRISRHSINNRIKGEQRVFTINLKLINRLGNTLSQSTYKKSVASRTKIELENPLEALFYHVMMNYDSDTQLISGALGHGSIQITQHYLSGFNTATQDELTDNFGSMFWSLV